MDHACFSGQDCLSLDRSPQAPIQDLYVIGKVKKCSLLILLQMSCYQSSFKIGTFIKAAVSKRNLITSPGAGGTSGISGWGCAAGTLEPLTYTRASSAEFGYPILE